jgi:hypothetical protein
MSQALWYSGIPERTNADKTSEGKFVLRRYDWDADLPWLFASYTENVDSKPTVLNGKRAATIFIRDNDARIRACKLGWQDETDEWKSEHEKNQSSDTDAVSINIPDKKRSRKRVKKS